MTELKLYFHFLKQNWLIIALPPLVGLIVGITSILLQPPMYQVSRWYTVDYSNNPQQQVPVADHIVTVLRSDQIKKDLHLESKVIVYKPSPLSFQIILSSTDKNLINLDLETINHYLLDNFAIKKYFSDQESEKVLNVYFPILLSLGIGSGFGLLLALVKTYLRKY